MVVRTRFAPSPTGFLHIGSVRTALFDYLLAKKYKGKVILRIEDTDQKRQVEGALENLLETLDWLRLNFDEGPHIGGPYSPYIQTQRLDIYNKYIQKLLEKGQAYYCFCSQERLQKLRLNQKRKKQAPRYDGYCRNLSLEEVNKKIKQGKKFVVRQKMPRQGTTICQDELRGKIEFQNKDLDDHVLIKSNGIPTYQFASVVDDYLMKITHVIRGAEWIPSLPKNILLYQAFGWSFPKFIHIPLTLNKEGGKLSKRQGDVAVEDYKQKGYLPEALLNFSALLGWHPKNEKEIFTLEELITEFSLEGLGTGSAIFDIQKLRWINAEHIRRKTVKEFHQLALPYYKKVNKNLNLKEISKILHKRVEVLGEIPEMIDFLTCLPNYDAELFVNKKMKTDQALAEKVLKKTILVFESIKEWNEQNIKKELLRLVEKTELKNSQVLWPVRVALSGKRFTPGGAFEIANILGRDESLKRLKIGIQKLTKK